MNQVVIAIQAVHHENSTLEAREVTKLHYRDSTSTSSQAAHNQSGSYSQHQRPIR